MTRIKDSGYPMSDAQILEAAEVILTAMMSTQGQQLSTPMEAGRAIRMRLAHQDREIFTCMFLDTRHRVIATEDLFQGTIDGCEVHPREVVRRALHYNAAAIIVGHNHPSDNPEPSAADRAVTARLKQALALVDIRLLDHFVVCKTSEVSLAARGWV